MVVADVVLVMVESYMEPQQMLRSWGCRSRGPASYGTDNSLAIIPLASQPVSLLTFIRYDQVYFIILVILINLCL